MLTVVGIPMTIWVISMDCTMTCSLAWRLADALESYGLLNDTMVVVVSEMSRTPVMNSDNGKDHWSYTSALLFGGNLEGGRVLGGTDETLSGQGINLEDGSINPGAPKLQYDQFVAGILHAAGDDAEGFYPMWRCCMALWISALWFRVRLMT